ncbi:hypothetical protein BH23VER1_BH23VER1_13960 [soil metagenome]
MPARFPRSPWAAFAVAAAASALWVAGQAAAQVPESIRVMTFNTSLFRASPGKLVGELESVEIPQPIRDVARVIQHLDPNL